MRNCLRPKTYYSRRSLHPKSVSAASRSSPLWKTYFKYILVDALSASHRSQL